jgi:heme exporter protein CcmD
MLDFTSDYIAFVLTAYGLAAVVLLGLVVNTLQQARRLKRQLADMNLTDPGQKEVSTS